MEKSNQKELEVNVWCTSKLQVKKNIPVQHSYKVSEEVVRVAQARGSTHMIDQSVGGKL